MSVLRMRFRNAEAADIQAIVRLVNRAYRPALDAAGWTHESNLVSGNRITPAQVASAIAGSARNESAVLLGCNDTDIVACAHVEQHHTESRIGMLAVAPELQGRGAGKQMLAYAEEYSGKYFAAERFVMFVLSARSELIAFYLRRGYRKTGQLQDYPLSAETGTPMNRDLKVEAMEKLRPAQVAAASQRYNS